MGTNKKVTVVLTSCNRLDLLDNTIKTFHKFNTYPIEEFIIIEDSTDEKAIQYLKENYKDYTLIFNEKNIGDFKSIDKAYSQVKTPYIFHLEDDWEFVKEGFIEDSFKFLDFDSKIIKIWLRSLDDTNGHPYSDEKYINEGLGYHKMDTNYYGFTGFSTNPGLIRLSDHNSIGGLGQFGPDAERLAGKLFLDKGCYAVIIDQMYIRHTGWENSRKHVWSKRKNTLI